MPRTKSKSAPGFLNVFSSKERKNERKKELSRKLFAELSQHVDDFETNQNTRDKVKEIITTYREEILRESSTEATYALNLIDIQPAVDTLIEEYANHPQIDTICGMILYGEIRNSNATHNDFLRTNNSVGKQWIKGRFITNKEEDIVPKMGTIFRVAFCDMKVLKPLESILGKNIQFALQTSIRGTILAEPNPLNLMYKQEMCDDLAKNAMEIITQTKKRFAAVVEPTADATVADAILIKPTADAITVIKPKKRFTVSDMFAVVAKVFTEWLFGAKSSEKSATAGVAGSPEARKNSVLPDAGLRLKSKQTPFREVGQSIPMTAPPSRRNNNSLSLSSSSYNFHNEHKRNTEKEAWEAPQPLCPLTDEQGSPLLSRFVL